MNQTEIYEFLSNYKEEEHGDSIKKSRRKWDWVCESVYKLYLDGYTFVLSINKDNPYELEIWYGGELISLYKDYNLMNHFRRIDKLEELNETV